MKQEIVDELYRRKRNHGPTNAYVTTVKPLLMRHWNGKYPIEENETVTEIPAGSTLKIVMVSRFGDCGLTDNLDAIYGYGVRVDLEDEALTNFRWTA